MKSAHRHELQTNALAQRLDIAIQRLRPWVSTLAMAIIAIAVLMLIWSYLSRSSATRQVDAWNAFNQAVSSMPPDMEEIHQSAQEHPGTQMQELADVTWADGQVYLASENYLYNRRAANEALDRAFSAYQGVLQTSSDARLLNRSHLGLARIYELRNELEKAREEYLKVGGGYAEYAKMQAERLAEPDSKDVYAWLDKAEPPRVQPPAGPGTPGQRPAFSAGDLTLPEATPEGPAPGSTDPAASFEDLLKGLRTLPSEGGDRYEGEGASPATDQLPGTSSAPATESAAPPADSAALPPTSGTPTDGAATPPADDKTAEEEKSAE
jgi:hypothetical protein